MGRPLVTFKNWDRAHIRAVFRPGNVAATAWDAASWASPWKVGLLMSGAELLAPVVSKALKRKKRRKNRGIAR